MKVAYLDSSSLLSIVFSEPGHDLVAASIEECDQLFSSNLMEAEVRSALRREEIDVSVAELIEGYEWVLPSRTLSHEFSRALEVRYLKGADLWHISCALVLAEQMAPDPVWFITLDQRQLEVAERLGLRVL